MGDEQVWRKGSGVWLWVCHGQQVECHRQVGRNVALRAEVCAGVTWERSAYRFKSRARLRPTIAFYRPRTLVGALLKAPRWAF